MSRIYHIKNVLRYIIEYLFQINHHQRHSNVLTTDDNRLTRSGTPVYIISNLLYVFIAVDYTVGEEAFVVHPQRDIHNSGDRNCDPLHF